LLAALSPCFAGLMASSAALGAVFPTAFDPAEKIDLIAEKLIFCTF